jgi:hypothetical protein
MVEHAGIHCKSFPQRPLTVSRIPFHEHAMLEHYHSGASGRQLFGSVLAHWLCFSMADDFGTMAMRYISTLISLSQWILFWHHHQASGIRKRREHGITLEELGKGTFFGKTTSEHSFHVRGEIQHFKTLYGLSDQHVHQ